MECLKDYRSDLFRNGIRCYRRLDSFRNFTRSWNNRYYKNGYDKKLSDFIKEPKLQFKSTAAYIVPRNNWSYLVVSICGYDWIKRLRNCLPYDIYKRRYYK